MLFKQKIKNNATINKEETLTKLKEKIANFEKIICKHEITIQTLEKAIKKHGHAIPNINYDIQDNDSQDEMEDKKMAR